MKASDYIAQFMRDKGVDHVFELVGGMIAHLIDSFHQLGDARIVSFHHEQGAAFAACGFGRIAGKPVVAMATSGPGAINLLNGMASCHFDSTPAIFITGQVNRREQRGDRAIRQLGFQETDIVPMARPITKAAWLDNEPADLPAVMEEAYRAATEGRPGPVLVDIPMDVQRADIEPPKPAPADRAPAVSANEVASFMTDALAALEQAEKPLILVGGGIRSGRCAPQTRELIRRLGIPTVHSLMGVDVLPADDPLRAGFIGSYGNRWANMALSDCDHLLVLGSRLDVKQTGADTDGFQSNKKIFHVDCEAGETNNRLKDCRVCLGELADFLPLAVGALEGKTLPEWSAWQTEIARLRAEWPDTGEATGLKGGGVNPNQLMHDISAAARAAKAFVADVGQHQMWAAQSLDLTEDQRFLTSGGLGSMGFGLPAAIGASLATGNGPVALIAGDGGFQCNIQEVQTAVRNKLPVKMVVLNNHSHGMVRQFQDEYFGSRHQSTRWGYDAPPFAEVAKAYGMPSRRIDKAEECAEALAWLWEDPLSAALLEVEIAPEVNAYPKMAFGRPLSEMEPFAKPTEIEGT